MPDTNNMGRPGWLHWLKSYRRADLGGDLSAGIVVAIMLIPQAMAYAMLAGLPPQMGLYASVLPLLVYAALGTSMTLAVGPVAIDSLLVGSALAGIAVAGTTQYVQAAAMLTLMVGGLLGLLGLFRVGILASFLSHPVSGGFTSAAAVIIAVSQVKHLLGMPSPAGLSFGRTVEFTVSHLRELNPATALIGLMSVGLMLASRQPLAAVLKRYRLPAAFVSIATRTGALLVIAASAIGVWALGLDATAGVKVVGHIPSGLFATMVPAFDAGLLRQLLPSAVLIAFVGFMETISSGRALAAKRRQRIEANRELFALGAANLASSLSGGYVVAGGLSRSSVNFTAGANTPLASVITASLVAAAVTVLMPTVYYVPQAALAAVVMVAVFRLFDLAGLTFAWHYNKADAASWIATFAVVLFQGVGAGIVAGVALSLLLYLWRTSRPHIAVVGRIPGTEHYRNVLRYRTQTCPRVLAMRIDESLYFANAGVLEDRMVALAAERPQVHHMVLICSAVNFIDASALQTLENIIDQLRDAGVTLHLAEVKGPVMDALSRTGLLAHLSPGQVFMSTHQAMTALNCV